MPCVRICGGCYTAADAAYPRWRMSSPAAPPDNGRLLQLSDGVFAVAITLLVFGLNAPNPRSVPPAQLAGALRDQAPHIVSFALSFIVIGQFWTIHHRIFRYVKSHDGGLIWLNMALLLAVSFLPYPTTVMGSYSSSPLAVALYGASMGVTSLLQNALWLYARHDPRLTHEVIPARVTRYYPLRGFSSALVFLLSIPLAWLHPRVAQASWLLIPVAFFVISRRLPGDD